MTDVVADWAVLDTAAGLLDTAAGLSHTAAGVSDAGTGLAGAGRRRFFTAIGEERREFLHGQTTANVESLAAGSGAAALALTAQGKPLAIFALYEDGEKLWISTTAEHAGATRSALSRFLVADDCDFEDEVDAPGFAVVGPRAAQVLAVAGAQGVLALAGWGMGAATIAGEPVMLFAREDLRVPCFDVLVCNAEGASGDAAAVRRAVEAAGARPCSQAALEIVRVESGTASFGIDVDETRLAVEARLEWAIHFAKGCYVGQEVVERAVSRGRINHELCLLKLSAAVASGARVDGGGDHDIVTSVVASPRLGTIALAYVPRSKAEAGTALTVLADGANIEAIVLPWPRKRTLAGRS